MRWTRDKNELTKNTTLVVGAVVVALLVAEVALRVFFPREPSLTIVDDPVLGVRAEPGGEWDANGFRNPSVPENPEIVIMGDSQTRGLNAQSGESWPAQLGDMLKQEVYQMAFDRYGTAQYSYLTQQALQQFNPDIVVWGLYLGNDLFDTYDHIYSHDHFKQLRDPALHNLESETAEESSTINRVVREGIDRDTTEFKLLEARQWIRSHSRIYTLLGDSTRGLRESLGFAETPEEKNESREAWILSNPELAFIYNEQPLNTVLSPAYRFDVVDLANRETREGWRLTQKLIRESRKNVEQSGGQLMLVIIPTKEMVYGTFMQNINQAMSTHFLALLEKEVELRQTINVFCAQQDILCHDVTGSLAAALQKGEKIYPETLDGHPLAEGYKVVAESVAQFITESISINAE